MSFPLASLGDFVKIARNGISPEKIQSGTNYVGLENIDGSGNFVDVKAVDAGELASAKFLFTRKQVLFGKLRPYLKKIARPDFDGVCSTDILPLLPSKEIDRGYLFHTLRRQSFVDDVSSLSSGANLPRISPKVLSEMQIPLPPVEEQRRIAAILDKADAVRAQRRAAIAKLDELLQSVFVEMFGDPVTNPLGWPRVTFGEVTNSRLGKMLDKKTSYGNHMRPYLANINVQWGRFELGDLRQMNFPLEDREEFSLRSGDILMCEGGEPGRCAIWKAQLDDCYYQKALHRIRCRPEKCVPEYIQWLFWFLAKAGAFRSSIAVATIAHLPGIKLKKLEIPLPSLDRQQCFARIAEKIESQKQTMQRAADKSETLFASLQQRAFSGKL